MGKTSQLELEDLLAGGSTGLEHCAAGGAELPPRTQQPVHGAMKLSPTFAYAGSLDRHPSVARFDVRDKVCLRVGGFRHGQVVCDKDGHKLLVIGVRCWEGKARLWFQPMDLQRPGVGAFWNLSAAGLRAVASASCAVTPARLEDFDAAEASDSEEVCLCSCCHLPVGEVGYDGEGYLLHGECVAKNMLQELRDKEEVQRTSDEASKQECRAKYDIGWSLERMPSNAALATRMLLPPAMQPGLYCVMLHKDGDRVHLAPATEPAAAVNLEYLSIALQVRTKEGREPLFSLDPHTDFATGNPMQIKRFEPSWLEGTSVGDLLFQADYHLKELSMGEHHQPVLGMRSALELLGDEAQGMEWNAREWFVVKKAEVFVSDARALVPRVQMGVEARTQVDVCGVLVDSPLTKPDHPLVKYAEAFSHNFDLIAERKSVIFHLRELAKATVLAKFLLESELRVGPALFSAASPTSSRPSMREVPQLWTERKDGQLRVEGGHIFPASGLSVKRRTIYGGVDLTLQRFPRLHYPPVEITGEFEAFPTKLGYQAYKDQQEQAAAKATAAEKAPPPPLTAAFQPPPTAAPVRAPARRPPPRERRQVYRPPQGVDLNLDAFDISTNWDAESDHPPGWWGALLHAHTLASKAFWQSLDESEDWSGMGAQDTALLREVFHRHLADRRLEGDQFMLPDTRRSYLQRLHRLVLEEQDVRQLRLLTFLSESFRPSSPGHVFPMSWTPSFQVRAALETRSVRVPSRSDFKDKAIADSLASVTPAFSRSTEDGMQFRIYRVGAVEVRTTQQRGAEEVVGAAFLDQSTSATPGDHIDGCDVVTKVTEYVEQESEKVGWWACFVVLETAAGRHITTRKLPDGTVTWQDGAPGCCLRLSAKVLRSCECAAGTCVRDIEILMAREAENLESEYTGAAPASLSYSQRVYSAAVGEARPSSARRRQPCQSVAVQEDRGHRRRQLEKYFKFTASRERRAQERRHRADA